ncbi:hypothetical protein CTA2_11787 [Colletotrichum tanaceti]|uniref:Uncharacterized protein n=1 Tax=Colletotrichum tanaceti TaxID=1306861 RepID=A0A4U6XHL5_9PEZI|nr:hypothetical protein CTA2_11787 [Colletotrichum tanaceti]TKW55410.1 hypothetical protein CTA1_2579 [Colletotrichum tanaceti]
MAPHFMSLSAALATGVPTLTPSSSSLLFSSDPTPAVAAFVASNWKWAASSLTHRRQMVNPTGPWFNEEEDFHEFLRNGPQIVDASNTVFVVPTPTTESPAPESATSTAETHSAVELESTSTELAIEDPEPSATATTAPTATTLQTVVVVASAAAEPTAIETGSAAAVGKSRMTGLPRGSLMGHYYAW